jgi:hypothetical protein
MKHSHGHIIEMSWSFATEWIKAVHMFEYRLLHELPEDKIFKHKTFRDNVDFHCFLISCRQLERAVTMAYGAWRDQVEKQELKDALETFKRKTPYLVVLRNVGEHFDDYLLQKGNDKSIDSRGLRVYSVEFEKAKTYKVNWLDYEIDIGQTIKVADELYKAFIVICKQDVARQKAAKIT